MASRAATDESSTPAVVDADHAQIEVKNPGLLMVGIMAASLLQMLDTTIANVAIPHMQSSLGATSESVTWVLTSYIIASAIALPATGWLSDKFGARALFLFSVIAFVLTSMLCGLAQNLEQMVIFRAAQGITGAFIPPLAQSFMLDTSKPSRHPQVMAIWGIGIMIAPILGPFLGGWLTESANWRWVFFVNIPLGIMSVLILFSQLPYRDKFARKFDLFGFLALAIALSSLQLLLDRGNQVDWFDSGEIWLYSGLLIASAWVAIIHMTTHRNPLFEMTLFLDRNLVISLTFMLLVGVVMFANMALIPPMLQHLFGYSVIDSGIALMPRGFGVLFSMQLAGLLMRKGFDTRILVGSGFALTAYSLWLMSTWNLDTDFSHILITGFIQGLGMGQVFIPLTVGAFITLPPRLRTDGSSLMNLSRSIGASVGISVTTTLLSRNTAITHEELAGTLDQSAFAPLDFAVIDRFQGAGETALRMLDGMLVREAAMVGFLNNFYLMMWFSLSAVFLVPLMRHKK